MISLQNLEGSVVVVSGAGRGLGAAMAVSLAEAGSRPILCGRNREALESVASTILERTGVQTQVVELDLGDAASVARAVTQLKAEHEVIDILINNGAMWLESSEEDHRPEEVLAVVNAAVSGTFLLTQGLMPLLRGSSRPDIVTIGSISGLPGAAIQTTTPPSGRRPPLRMASPRCWPGRPFALSSFTRPISMTSSRAQRRGKMRPSVVRASAQPTGTSSRRCCSR